MRIILGIMLAALVAGCGAPKEEANPFRGTQLVITYKTEPPFVVTESILERSGETGHTNPSSGFEQSVRWTILGDKLTLAVISDNKEYASKEFATLSASTPLFDKEKIKVEVKASQ